MWMSEIRMQVLQSYDQYVCDTFGSWVIYTAIRYRVIALMKTVLAGPAAKQCGLLLVGMGLLGEESAKETHNPPKEVRLLVSCAVHCINTYVDYIRMPYLHACRHDARTYGMRRRVCRCAFACVDVYRCVWVCEGVFVCTARPCRPA